MPDASQAQRGFPVSVLLAADTRAQARNELGFSALCYAGRERAHCSSRSVSSSRLTRALVVTAVVRPLFHTLTLVAPNLGGVLMRVDANVRGWEALL